MGAIPAKGAKAGTYKATGSEAVRLPGPYLDRQRVLAESVFSVVKHRLWMQAPVVVRKPGGTQTPL